MALYIQQDNQKLLWNVISKHKIVNDYFMIYPTKKNGWFKSIVELFYEKNKHRILNQTDLLLLNKETISYMVQNIRELFPINSQQPQPKPQTFLKPYSVTENKVERIGNQFNEKKMEYDSLFEKKVPENIEFTEKQDTPLSNMDELIKQHLQERESELKLYAPLPLVSPPSGNAQVVEPSKLKINKTSENINIHIEELPPTNKKTVSWLDNTTIEKQQIEIDELKLQVQQLFEKIKLLENKSSEEK